ncbi:unnamed protein product [Pedinophyceae sp. YPF-701]|nr:unnamed protein product [Pedinophyceae sp. YPF-701]
MPSSASTAHALRDSTSNLNMSASKTLQRLGLRRNPFVDRTGERTGLDPSSLYVHSDLQDFHPNEMTYLFFGRRGAGKTTIRLQLEKAYAEANEQLVGSGKSLGHFIVDLTKPGALNSRLIDFRKNIGCPEDAWDQRFSETWTEVDLVDTILSVAATQLLQTITAQGPSGNAEVAAAMAQRLRSHPQRARQAVLLCVMYAQGDSRSLQRLEEMLLQPRWGAEKLTLTAGLAAGVGLASMAAKHGLGPVRDGLARFADAVHLPHTRAAVACGAAAAAVGAGAWMWSSSKRPYARAAEMLAPIRILQGRPPKVLAGLLEPLFPRQDSASTIRSLYIGTSTSAKLDLLSGLVKHVGYESLAVFGDCFDEVPLLDPVLYPSAMKTFAREVCRNDLLSVGRQHWFFPDSRLALDLSTDKTMREARFDRHFVRDLEWSRHQLQELAEQRWLAASQDVGVAAGPPGGRGGARYGPTLEELFEMIRVEDLSGHMGKLRTPRELLIMMSEVLARLEANPGGSLTSQDMEICVNKAKEQGAM